MLNLKLALRTLFKSPFVTIVAVVSLALGSERIQQSFRCSTSSSFDRCRFRSPRGWSTSPRPAQARFQSCNQAGDCDVVFSYPMFRDLERVQTTFTGIAAHRLFGANLAYRGQTLSGDGVFVSGSYFPVLGMQPALGRLLGPATTVRSANRPSPCSATRGGRRGSAPIRTC